MNRETSPRRGAERHAGTLFLVATPIGNLEDITKRAVRVLGEVDLIAAEDTRHTRRMLDHFGLEVKNLAAFCKKLEANGVKFVVPYTKQPSGIASAFLTDPWGTYIELTEGL